MSQEKNPRHLFDRVLTQIEQVVMICSYLVLITLVGGETIRRTIFQQQATWGPEVAMYAFIWLSWFAMARHCRYGTSLAFSGVRVKLSAPFRRVLEIIDSLLWLTIGTIVLYTSIDLVSFNVQAQQMLLGTRIPLWVANIAVPIGWLFSMLRVGQRAWLVVFNWKQIEQEQLSSAQVFN